MPDNKIFDVHCSSCGAAVQFDIMQQVYNCKFCGTATPTTVAVSEKKGFREFARQKMDSSRPSFAMSTGSCNNCGAKVIFPENEAMTECTFCGKTLVRGSYTGTKDFPELLIPFYITAPEAEQILSSWCDQNRKRPEARILKKHASGIKGVYLPYELARGPVSGSVRRNNTRRMLSLRGFVDGIFVNASEGLDNLLLNGMEPYDLRGVREMDFSFLSGSTVKIRDVSEEDIEERIADEIAYDYESQLVKTMETKAFNVNVVTKNMMHMSVLLPVYYIQAGNVIAAVNGQTGKVAVRERRDRFLLPWWIKPIFLTALVFGICILVTGLLGGTFAEAVIYGGMISIIFLITSFALFSDYSSPRWRLRRRIFTSSGGPYVRNEGKLVQNKSPLPTGVPRPVIVESIKDQLRAVRVKYSAAGRMAFMFFLMVLAIGLPLLIVLANPGTAVAGLFGAILCITVPTAPIYFLKFGRFEIYEHPWFYYRDEKGRQHKYKAKGKWLTPVR